MPARRITPLFEDVPNEELQVRKIVPLVEVIHKPSPIERAKRILRASNLNLSDEFYELPDEDIIAVAKLYKRCNGSSRQLALVKKVSKDMVSNSSKEMNLWKKILHSKPC